MVAAEEQGTVGGKQRKIKLGFNWVLFGGKCSQSCSLED